MINDVKEVLISEEDIMNKVSEIAGMINEDYAGKPLLIIGVLKGANVFVADLIRKIKIPVILDSWQFQVMDLQQKVQEQLKFLKILMKILRVCMCW